MGAVRVTGANGSEMVGEVLGGRYRVTAMIGRGGMGVVARAVDQVLNREVAVKVLRAYTDASAAELADLRIRMEREAQAAARIRHSGVVTVHDVVEERGLPVIVMELVDGPSLDDVLTERGPLDPREVAAIGAKIMDALDAAHRAGVLHRDVKPGNVLLERSGRVVLTDFGIASMEATDGDAMAKLTQSGQIVGSLDYLPPERAQGQEPGPASDIWSLGMTLYAAVEGTAPFRRTSAWSTLAAIVTEALPEAQRSGPLAPVLRALMAKDPRQRPDAAQARAMLEAVAAGTSPTPTPPPVQAPAPAPVPAPGPVTPPLGAFGPAVAPPQQPVPQPGIQPVPQPGMQPGIPAGRGSRSETRTAIVRARRRRSRTVVAAAVATVLVGGGVAYALMNKDGEPGGTPQAAPPTTSAPADGDMSGAGGLTDDPTAPGDLTSMAPDGTPTGTPTKPSTKTPTTSPADDKPTTTPSAPPRTATPSTTVKEPTPLSTACTGWAHSNRSDGYGNLSQNSHLYTGPYSDCGWVTPVKDGVKVYYHCYVTNAHGNKWIYARIEGTETEGWVFADKTTGGSGSLARC
ncbi:protein kinase [Streptomyces sp. P9(2023)]|uniref:serine/threonine-protein kinase n=1 Tax=Streptomyces sp. P9(2023) TaxID=3064394 RepID=UPI0028F40CE5|nr:protein kinase [Streptomyces sp. P9(2023)]MDT9692151.1 protein kinase [Streptomyces sp. P9(2023)]